MRSSGPTTGARHRRATCDGPCGATGAGARLRGSRSSAWSLLLLGGCCSSGSRGWEHVEPPQVAIVARTTPESAVRSRSRGGTELAECRHPSRCDYPPGLVGTDKRERQRAARLEKAAAQATAAKRDKTKHSAIRIVVGALVVLAVLFAVTQLMGDDSDGSDDAETSDTTEATADDTTDDTTDDTATDPALGFDESDGSGEFAYGTTPCPPPEGAAEPTLSFDDSFEQCIDPAKTY